jgi:glycosyltransferase involved in cell wall biosynthesis
MSDSPLVSVILGAYNEEDTIAATLQSLLGQSMADIEIIAVDDGSTDGTAEVVGMFEDSRVRLLSLERNVGLPGALNRGIEAARGPYIARADADELSFPFRLQRQSTVLAENPHVQAVGCRYQIRGRRNECIVTKQVDSRTTFDVESLLQNGPRIAHGSVMLRKSAVTEVGGYREEFQLAQDYDLWLQMAEHFGEGWLHIVPETLYLRTIQAEQLAKRERQRAYGYAARECAKMRQQGR